MLDLRLCEDSLLRSRNKIRHPPKAEPFSSSVEAIRIIVISNFVYFIIFLVYRILFNFFIVELIRVKSNNKDYIPYAKCFLLLIADQARSCASPCKFLQRSPSL